MSGIVGTWRRLGKWKHSSWEFQSKAVFRVRDQKPSVMLVGLVLSSCQIEILPAITRVCTCVLPLPPFLPPFVSGNLIPMLCCHILRGSFRYQLDVQLYYAVLIEYLGKGRKVWRLVLPKLTCKTGRHTFLTAREYLVPSFVNRPSPRYSYFTLLQDGSPLHQRRVYRDRKFPPPKPTPKPPQFSNRPNK